MGPGPNGPATELAQWYSHKLVREASTGHLTDVQGATAYAAKTDVRAHLLDKTLSYVEEEHLRPDIAYTIAWNAPDYRDELMNDFRELGDLCGLYSNCIVAANALGPSGPATEALTDSIPAVDIEDYPYTDAGPAEIGIDEAALDSEPWIDGVFERALRNGSLSMGSFDNAVKGLNAAETPEAAVQHLPHVINGVRLNLGKKLADFAGGMKKYAALPDMPTNMTDERFGVRQSERVGVANGIPMDIESSDIYDSARRMRQREVRDFADRIGGATPRRLSRDLNAQRPEHFTNYDNVFPDLEPADGGRGTADKTAGQLLPPEGATSAVLIGTGADDDALIYDPPGPTKALRQLLVDYGQRMKPDTS